MSPPASSSLPASPFTAAKAWPARLASGTARARSAAAARAPLGVGSRNAAFTAVVFARCRMQELPLAPNLTVNESADRECSKNAMAMATPVLRLGLFAIRRCPPWLPIWGDENSGGESHAPRAVLHPTEV
eukprot:6286-Heterococcus_DN1.PRE.2